MCVTRGTIISSFGEKIGPLAESGFNKVGKILALEALSRNPDGQFALSAKGRSLLTDLLQKKKGLEVRI